MTNPYNFKGFPLKIISRNTLTFGIQVDKKVSILCMIVGQWPEGLRRKEALKPEKEVMPGRLRADEKLIRLFCKLSFYDD